MKKQLTTTFMLMLSVAFFNNTFGQQWTTSGNNIYNANTGNVGVGTTSPSSKFQVIGESRMGSSGNYVKVNSSGSLSFTGNANLVIGDNKYAFKHSGGGNRSLYINKTSSRFEFRDSLGNDLMHVDYYNGNGYILGSLGLGTNAPQGKLEIKHNSSGSSPQLSLNEDAADYARINFKNNSGSSYWAIGALNHATQANERFSIYNSKAGADLLVLTGNGNLGVGITSPAYKVDIAGSLHVTNGLVVDQAISGSSLKCNNGSMGLHKDIGLNFREYNFSINGSNALSMDYTNFTNPNSTTANLFQVSTAGSWTINNTLALTSLTNNDALKLFTGAVNPAFKINTSDYGDYIEMHLKPNTMNGAGKGAAVILGDDNTYLSNMWGDHMQIHSYNGVRITKDGGSPFYTLDVCGTTRSTEVRVEPGSGWCDYVFKKDYKLKSLTEVESFIKGHGHLEGIPPAAVVEQEGIKLGEMSKAMMEKIEELTLYVIDLQKQLFELKNKTSESNVK